MTNYAAWDAFDSERAIEEVDQPDIIKDFTSMSDDVLNKHAADNLGMTLNATRKAADALRSKVLFFETSCCSSSTIFRCYRGQFGGT